eukprot:12423458-Alexandrium_andersonii.AAC.1
MSLCLRSCPKVSARARALFSLSSHTERCAFQAPLHARGKDRKRSVLHTYTSWQRIGHSRVTPSAPTAPGELTHAKALALFARGGGHDFRRRKTPGGARPRQLFCSRGGVTMMATAML